MPASTVLLLGAERQAAEPINASLTAAGYAVTILDDADEAFRRVPEFTVVIIDQVSGPRPAVEVCREIRTTPAMAAIPVLCITQSDDVEERVRFLEAGADDVIGRPFDARELEARVEALLVRFRRSRDLAPLTAAETTSPGARQVVACYSPKGGVGTTTIAVNVATWLASQRPGRVVAVDLDLPFGQVATHLNIKPRQTLADLLRDVQALREPELLRSYTEHHGSGLQVLAAPVLPDDGGRLDGAQVDRLLATLRAGFDAVVVDAGSGLDERILAIFERADTVILPIVPEIAALKALHSLMDYLTEEGTVGPKSTFVLNHLFAREMLTMKQIEGVLGAKIDVELPYDPGLYLKAVNEGNPLVRGAPKSPVAERFARLALVVTGWPEPGAEAAGEERRSGLFGGLRRRS
ncbi:MAG: response regulator receiver protein [Chloroflexi bacterium]|nr:response regulator receiver protein [Chloroflexota bacterium]